MFTNTLGTAVDRSRGVATDAGIFLTDQLWLTPTVSVIGSYRFDRYAADLASTFYNNTASDLKVKPSLKSPRASLVWEPADRPDLLPLGQVETLQGTSR